ncbi:hypothetical protein CBE01nite_44740 [Clostridium beijerinckii]|uniref:DUF2798 domain-containing protein n=1 Tax=Clostridium beijerinckii TaxID=1520 RepID=A0AB74VAV4_CLOBE|nr:hypothetical protein [Clostridium beijerinckii]NRZ27772.1 hypothetical protein [Clostridium beijerinckii]NYB96448.1 hypothetical protein [Clostridium beijerinckii]OOM23743.1 hypothetical protein CLBEI_25360 [Clostridium beijerinckii]QUN33554.1 hypothetical protein KEC93_16470 [Clostridium beijerinckii]SQB01347.1 Uncharacterised protein [Clostridium beijerinckii]
MSKKNYVNILTVILTFIIVHIIYNLTGFHYNFSEVILNLKLLIDLGLWLLIYVPVNMILDKILLSKGK